MLTKAEFKKEADKIRDFGELVINMGTLDVCLLSGLVYLDEMSFNARDLYYVLYDKDGQHILYPMCGGYAPLRGFTSIKHYSRMLSTWGYNYRPYHSAKDVFTNNMDDSIIYLKEINPDVFNRSLYEYRMERIKWLQKKFGHEFTFDQAILSEI